MKHPLLAILLIFLRIPALFAQDDPYPDVNLSELTGFVDMHTHPRSDLSYGTELFYGCPYGDISKELGDCSAHHGAWGLKNKHGNVFRAEVSAQTEGQYNRAWVDGKQGYPDFATWPSWCSVLHQQMWIDWIQRAHEGGLNVMVALTAHSHCIADAAETTGPNDDEQAMLNSIQGIKDLVAQGNFMEVALTPQDLRRIVGSGKLAVIIGVEADNIGNFYDPIEKRGVKFNPNPSQAEIKAELDMLWGLGVRYIFPVHITNNVFGGTAIYVQEFNIANKYNTGLEFAPEPVSTAESGIAFHLNHPILSSNPEAELLAKIVIRMSGGILPKSVNPSVKENYTFRDTVPGHGVRNSMGLTEKGRFAVEYMMQKGYIIDIDHMGEKTANEVLAIAAQHGYPVNSGHNGLRGKAGNENDRTAAQYAQIIKLGGMIGLGHGSLATRFVGYYRELLKLTGYRNVAIGTDVNGFYPLPMPDTSITVTYGADLTKCSSGNRTWDINTDGFAHYGLFPDYIKSWEAAGMTAQEKYMFMQTAEQFTQMWEKCETMRTRVGH